MPRSQSLLILGIAVFLGLIAVYLANTFLNASREPDNSSTPVGTVKVAVARVPIEFGSAVTPEKVRMMAWPADSVPEGAFTSTADLAPMGKVRMAVRSMMPNEPVLRYKLSGEGGRATISAVLKPDMRAAAVRVNDVAGVAGFVLPGDVVDVLVTRTVGGEQTITDVLLQNVRVIAIDQDSNDNKDQPTVGKTATLEVRQVDAQKLALAQQVGTLSLVLRNVADQTESVAQTVSLEDLRDGGYAMGSASAPAVAIPAAYTPNVSRPVRRVSSNGKTVEIVRGTKGSKYEVGRYVGF